MHYFKINYKIEETVTQCILSFKSLIKKVKVNELKDREIILYFIKY